MQKFLSKDKLEYYAKLGSFITALSVLTGAILQYSSLSYSDLSFFSFTQAINDGIKIFPVLLAVFLGGYAGYVIVEKLAERFESEEKKWYWHWSELVGHACLLTLSIIVLIGLNSSIKWLHVDYSKWIADNFIGLFVIGAGSIFFIIAVVIPVYLATMLFGLEFIDFSTWSKKEYPVAFFCGTAFLLFLIFLLKYIPETMDQYNCLEYNGKILKINYLSDKYVFTDRIIIENKDRVFYRYTQCNKSNVDLYIKKDGKCLKIDNFDENYISIGGVGLIKNSGYDFYVKSDCKP